MVNEKKEASYFDSSAFWSDHYKVGGNSGTGSYEHLAKFKADIINSLLDKYAVESVIEFGCGDGNVLSKINYKDYTGVDVAPVVIEQLKNRFKNAPHKNFYTTAQRALYMDKQYDMSLSMDVIFHLIEEAVFEKYMQDLFNASRKYVVVYSSNHEEFTKWPEYRHRNFISFIQNNEPDWRIIEFIPNAYPYIIGKEAITSASDFYIFEKKL